MNQNEIIVDCFAGGGGASLGVEMALGRGPDIAINHDREAIAMHLANHPGGRHFCEDVFDVDPREATGGRPVGLAWFSPDCTYHSKARGGKPFRDPRRAKRRRGLAWIVVKWAKLVRPRVIALENVDEFQNWGPLLEDGRPCPLRKGFTFRRWWKQLENLGLIRVWLCHSLPSMPTPATSATCRRMSRCARNARRSRVGTSRWSPPSSPSTTAIADSARDPP